ncbi:hypothetical protein YWY31_44720 [Paenibacillus illinoisensis]|uniref:hypothetical protein n=1 Tax=Paenibacillus illinoisensis TaxID=59845 RepID=UPI0034B75FE4
MKKITLYALCLTLSIVMTACAGKDKLANNSAANLSDIEIKVNNKKITSTIIPTSIKESDDLDMSSFESIMNNPDSVLPYVKIGETVSMKFDNQKSVPDSYELLDYVLTDQGRVKYKQPELTKIPMDFNNGTGSFVLPENLLTYASSDSQDYEPGTVLRGFRLVAKWGSTTQEIVFIIKTDAVQNEG